MLIYGNVLSPRLQAECKARFVHRFTRDHRPAWASQPMPNGKPYPVQFASDDDWLAHTFFEVTKQGELDERSRYCQSSPTWPEGQNT